MLPPYINSPQDLVTTREATRRGFADQAARKTAQAKPHVERAQAFHRQLAEVDTVEALTTDSALRSPLLAAVGLSDKARARLTSVDLDTILAVALTEIAQEFPDSWREQLVYRFLLNRGDTLGGSMRNLTGAAAGAQLATAIGGALQQRATDFVMVTAPRNPQKVVRMSWGSRVLVFDRKPRFVDKSVDAILVEADSLHVGGLSVLEQPGQYVACGELKGGIDPAGADEHWKTARSAFERIRASFQRQGLVPPALFFVAAAIERAMADEIFADLASGQLTYAANLTKPEQLGNLASWLVAL